MCDQSEIEYRAGEVVWCKLSNMWWPAQVQNQDDLDEEVTQGLRKRPLAVVKFFNEDYYDFVKDIKHICHYNSSRKLEFIRKGMDSYRSMGQTNKMSKFPQDIIMAEEITGGNVNILDDPRLAPEEKVSYKDVFTTPKTLKENKIVKRSKNVSVKGKLLSRYSPAFGKPGYEKNYFTKYLIQKCITPNNIQYHCPDCSFVCSRLVLLSYHRSYNKFHGCPKTPLKYIKTNSSLHKVEKTVIKRKSIGNDTSPLKKKSKPPVKGPNDEPPKKIIKVKAVVKQETKEKDKKKAEAMREQLLLDWNEEEGEESDDVAQDVSDTTESKPEEKPAGQSINTSLATSCFDFEDNEEDVNMDRSIRFGQKLPRVIPKDGKLKEKNASQDDGLEEEFNNLMKETVVPIMTDPFLLDSSALPDSTGKAEANLGSKANNVEENMKDTGGNKTKVTQPPSEVDLFKKSDDDNSSLLRALESDSPAEFEQKEYSGKSLKRCNSSSLSEKIAKKLKSDADLLASLRSDSDSNSSPPENLVTDKNNFSYNIPFDKPSENLDNVSSENIQIERLDNSTSKENEENLSKTRFSRRRSCSSKYNEKNVQTSEVITLEKSSTQQSYGTLNKDEHDIEPSKSGEFKSKSNKEKSPRKIMPARRCSTLKTEPSSSTKVAVKSIPNKKNSISPAKIGSKGTKGRLESKKSGPIRRSSTRRSTSSSQPENNSDETSNSLPEESVEKRIAMLLSDSSSESPNDPLPSCKRPSPSSIAKGLAAAKERNIGKHSKYKTKSSNDVDKSSLLGAGKRRLNKLLLEKRRGTPAGKKTDIHDNSVGRGHKQQDAKKDSKPQPVTTKEKGHGTLKEYNYGNIKTKGDSSSRKSRSQTKSVGGSKKRLYRLSSSDSTSPMRSPSRVNLKSSSSATLKNRTDLTLKDLARSTLNNQPKSNCLTRPEIKSPSRMEMKSPTRVGMKSPTRVGMKSSDRMGMKSPTRARMKSPMRVQMKSPKSTGMKSPTRVELKSPSRGEMRSPTSPRIKSPTKGEIKSPARGQMRSPTSARIKSPTRGEIKSPTRGRMRSPSSAGIKSPTRLDIKSPMRERMRSPTRAGIKSPTRPSMSALKSPKTSSVKSPTRSIKKRLNKRKSDEKVIKLESKSSKDHPLPSASVSKDKRQVSSQCSKNNNTASNKKKRVYDDPCSELFKPDVIIVKKLSSNVPSDSVGLPLSKSKVMSFSKSSDYDNKHSKDKGPTTSFQKNYKLQSHYKAPIESKIASSTKPTELSTKASAEVLDVPGKDQMKTPINDPSEDSIDVINKEALNVSSDGNSIDNGASKVSCDNNLINKEAPTVSSYDTDDLFSKESSFNICFPAKIENEQSSGIANSEVTESLVTESELNYSKYDSFSGENKSVRDSPKTSATSADSTSVEFKVSEKSDSVVNQNVLIMDSLMTEKDNDFKHLREVENTCQSHSSSKAEECSTLTSSDCGSESLLLPGKELADAQITVLPEAVKFDEKIVKVEALQCESTEVPCDAMKIEKDSSSQPYCSLEKPINLMEEILEEEVNPHMVSQSSGSVAEVQLSNTVQFHIKNDEQASETDHLIIENSIFCSKETRGDNFSYKNAVSEGEDTPKMIESQSTVHSFTSYHSDGIKLTNNCADNPHDSPQNHTSKGLGTDIINSSNKSMQSPQIHPQLDQTEDSVDKAMEEMFSCDVPKETSTEINLPVDSSSTENQLSILKDGAYKTVLPKGAVIKEMQSVVPEVDNPLNHSDNYSSAVVQQEIQMSETLSNGPEFPHKDDDHTGNNNKEGVSSDFLEKTVKPASDKNIVFDTTPGDKDASAAIKTDAFSLSCNTILTNNCSDSTAERETNSFGVNEGLTENESQHDLKIKSQVENSEDGNVNDQSKFEVNEEKTSDETVVSSEKEVPRLPNTPLDNTQMQVFENTQPQEVSQPIDGINLTSDNNSTKPIFCLSASVSEDSKQRVSPFVFKTEPHFRSIDLTEEEDLGEVGADYPASEIVISHDSGSDRPEADSLQNDNQPPVECNYTSKLGVESEVVISSESDGKLQSNEEAGQNTQTVSSEILINDSDYKIEASDDKINVADESLASEIVIDSESEDKSSLSFNLNDQTTSEVVITAESSDKTEEDIYNFDRPIVTTQVPSETTQLPPVTTLSFGSFGDVKLNVTNPSILPIDYPNIAVPDDFLTPDKIKEIFKQGDPKTQNPPQTSALIRPIVVPPQSLLGNELNPTQALIAGSSSLSQGFASQDVVTMELDINSMPIVIDDSPEDDIPSTSTSSLLNQCSSSDNMSTVRIAMLPANRRPSHVPYNYYIKLVEPGSCKPKPQSGCVVMGIPAAKSNSVATVQHQSTKTVQFVSQGHLTRSEEYKEYIIATSQGKKKIMLQNIDEFPTKSVFKPVSLAKSRVRTVANTRTRRIVSSQNIVNVQPTTVVPPQVRILPDSDSKKKLNYRTAVRSESNKKVLYRETNLSIAPNILANKKKSILKPTNKTVTIRMDRTIKDHCSSSPFVKPPGILKVCDRSVAGRRIIASPKPCLDSPDQSTSAVKKNRNPSRSGPKEDILAKALADTQVFQETEVSDTPASNYIEPTLFRSVSSNVPSMALDSSLVTSPDITTNVSYNIASTSFGQHAIIQPSMPLLSDEAALSQNLSVQSSQSAIPIFQLGCSPYVFTIASKTKTTAEGVSSISQTSNFNSNMITCSSSETVQQAVSNPTQLTADINLAEIELPPGQPPDESSSSNVFNDITTIPLPPEPFNNTLSPGGFLTNPTDNSPDNHNLTSLFQGVSNTHIS